MCFYLKDSLKATVCTPTNDKPDYEALWIRIDFNNTNILCCVVYHPPKPIYDVKEFILCLSTTMDDLLLSKPSSMVMLAGDLNQLTDLDISCMGLTPMVFTPTRGSSCLDKVYVSNSSNLQVKIVKSLVKSDHLAVIVYAGDIIINKCKTKTVLTYRRKTPGQHAAFLSGCKANDFEPVLNATCTQNCADIFYNISLDLLQKFYPVKTITVAELTPHL